MQLLHSNPGGLTQNGRKLQVFRAGIFTHHMKFNKAHNANIFSLAGPKAVLTRADRCIISLKHVLSGTDLGWSVGFQNSKDLQKLSRTENYIPETCLTRQNEENRKIIYRKLELAWIVQSNPHLHLDHFYLSPT